jgi:hypothetical protein
MRKVKILEEFMMRDLTIQQHSGEYEQEAQQYRFLAEFPSQPLNGHGTHLCDLYDCHSR